MHVSDDQRRLIDGWQRGLPLTPRPFLGIAEALGLSEARVLELLRALDAAGILSRVGATVRPNSAGASLLAAMCVAPACLDAIAAIVSAEPGVNHNYEREHAFNLWFVVTAPDRDALGATLSRLRQATRHDILELPMERAYFLDLGFPLDGSGRKSAPPASTDDMVIEAADRDLLAALGDGLEIQPRPYLTLARRCGATEDQVLARLARLIEGRVITRLGLIVKHRSLGFTANAMAVWDIADDEVDRIGERFARVPFVTLCYRRPRRLPDWRYNLFTMVHGRDRDTVTAQVDRLAAEAAVGPDRRATLFSRRCFLQRGARFKAA